jgi:hypothetical protein
MRCRRAGLISALCIALSVAALPTAEAASKDPISLVVMIAVDQMGAGYISAFAPLLEHGFARMKRRGAYFTSGLFEYSTTETSAGHATIVTGAWPNVHGLTSNYWFDHETGARVGCVDDPEAGKSPRFLMASTIADAIALATRGRSKSISIALKDRAAIIMAGQSPTAAIWYDDRSGRFVEGTWYGGRKHEWLAAVNMEKNADAAFGERWDRARSDLDYERWAGPDDVATEEDVPGLGRTFPRTLGQGLQGASPAWYHAFVGTPQSIDALLALAKRAVREEQLGRRGVVDLLSIGISTLDWGGHWWGPQSQEALDIVLRIDRAIEELIDAVELSVGRGSTLYVLTADHGVAPVPEVARSYGLKAERIGRKTVASAVDDAKTSLLDVNSPRIYLRYAEARGDRLSLQRAVAARLSKLPVVLEAHASMDVDLFREPYRTLMKRSLYPGREPDVMILQRPFDIFEAADGGATTGSGHGTPYTYDQTVPILFMGPGVRRGVDRTPYEMTRVAPTVCGLLGIVPPASAYDPPLPILDHDF